MVICFFRHRQENAPPLPDFRTLPRVTDRLKFSPDLEEVLNDVLLKQQWYREYQLEQDADPIPFIGRFNVKTHPDVIARDIRNVLQIDVDMRNAAASWEAFLREFIRGAEEAGILVMRSGVVRNNGHRGLKVTEFRGFAISDSLAPLVFINSKDSKAAQIFTLAHEIAHLWLGATGVSNPDFAHAASQQGNATERLCNRVAAEVLLPKDQFLQDWRDNAPTLTNMQFIARRYRVSTVAVLRQALDLEKISPSTYWAHFKAEPEKQTKKTEDDDGGGDFYATLFARNSHTFTRTVVTATAEGNLLHRDAAHLLNIKVRTLDGIAERLLGGPVLRA